MAKRQKQAESDEERESSLSLVCRRAPPALPPSPARCKKLGSAVDLLRLSTRRASVSGPHAPSDAAQERERQTRRGRPPRPAAARAPTRRRLAPFPPPPKKRTPKQAQASNKAAYFFLLFFLAAAGALWGLGLSRLIPLLQALVLCVQEDALAYAADPRWCLSPFASLAAVPLALTGAGTLAALAVFILLCFFCCCSLRPGMMARYGQRQGQQHQHQPQFLVSAPATHQHHDGGNSSYCSPLPQQQMRASAAALVDPEAGGATYWDEKAGRLVPGPGPAQPLSARTAVSSSSRSGVPPHAPPPPVVVPVAAYAPPASHGHMGALGEPVGASHDYPQVSPSV